MLVLESFIRLHADAPWPMRAEGCDFARDVQHDLHQPAELTQDDRDRRFWPEARWQITGPAGAKRRREPTAPLQAIMTEASS
jgi:hypothetical protein